MKNLNELASDIYENAKSKGFYDDGKANNFGERIALIHSELSECLEADRKNRKANIPLFEDLYLQETSVSRGMDDNSKFKAAFEMGIKDTVEDELADTIIRCLDMAAHLGIDIQKHVDLKTKYNSLRPKMHGGKKY